MPGGQGRVYQMHTAIPTGPTGPSLDLYYFVPIAAPGVVLHDDPNHAIPGRTVVIHTMPEQDLSIQKYIDSRKANPGWYKLFGRNCVDFVRDALRACGLSS
jgi:hypothetical protein